MRWVARESNSSFAPQTSLDTLSARANDQPLARSGFVLALHCTFTLLQESFAEVSSASFDLKLKEKVRPFALALSARVLSRC
jgi:hypothetical protein